MKDWFIGFPGQISAAILSRRDDTAERMAMENGVSTQFLNACGFMKSTVSDPTGAVETASTV